jgi:hypothetical protein
MLRAFSLRILAVAILAGAVAACDDDTTPTTPTGPAPTVTDTFTGSIGPNGSSTHNFTTAAAGPVTATLKTIGTDNTLVVSFQLGNWSGTACSIVLGNDAATGGHVLSGTMTGAGNLCVRVGDVGNIAAGASASYSVEVVHP